VKLARPTFPLLQALCSTALLLSGCDGEPEELISVDLLGEGEDAEAPRLPPPLTAEETTALREAFSWRDTQRLNEVDADGNPALYYTMIAIRPPEDEALLEMARVYFDAMPIFPEELEPWEDSAGIIEFEADEKGAFVYAVLAGAVYNHIRQAALEGEPVFDAVILRDPPSPDALLPGGSLSYAWLVEQGFTYGFSREELEEGDSSGVVGAVHSPLLGRIVRGIINIGRGIVNGIRRGIGVLKAGIGGTRPFRLELRVLNTDEAFERTFAFRGESFSDGVMRRAWGPNLNREISVPGAKVMIGVNASLTVTRTDDNGYAEIRIPKGKGLRVFLRLRNRAASITSAGMWDKRLAVFTGSRSRSGPVYISKEVRDKNVNVLAQFSDARAYSREIGGWSPGRALVHTGPIDGRSAAPCLGFMSYGRFGTVSWRGDSIVWNTLLGIFSYFTEIDVLMRRGSASRGVPTHEYGHYLMCDMLFHIKRRDFGRAWGEVARDARRGDMGEAGIIAEGWADFFAHQVAGGMNYFSFPSETGEPRGSMFYCDSGANPSTQPCLEDNVGGGLAWPAGQRSTRASLGGERAEGIARVATLLHDAFDGHADETAPVPGNGGNWTWLLSPFDTGPSLAWAEHASDENVALGTGGMYSILRNWSDRSNSLHYRPFFNAMAVSMLNAGYAPSEVCQLFALHSPTGACDELVSVASVASPLALAMPLGLVVRPSLPDPEGLATAELDWSDISPHGTGFQVQAYLGDTAIATEEVPYSREASAVLQDLPLGVELRFEVATRSGTMLGGAATATGWMPPEPVTEVSAVQRDFTVRVTWEQVNASEYIVEITDQVTGESWEEVQTSEAEALIVGLAHSRTYDFRVISINGAGERSAYPSPPASLFVREVILW
jgi:hypothetical protein